MKTTIYMVRHAESPFRFGQEQTRGLSEEGWAASMKVADVLSGIKVDYIASSSYARAVQTLQYLAEQKGLPIIQYEELRERPIKGLEHEADWAEILKGIEESFVNIDFALEGGESTREAQARSIPVIETMLEEYRGKNIVIGTHGNIMTIILNYYHSAFGYEFWKRSSMPDIYKLTFDQNQLESVERIWDDGKEKP
ncbi:histidine phosphatase family protein [Paenibacillus caui]|uniref:histidine phosphatase family protein n=1 Tax=Paenibacillus caui TaxID=2873927 RepID=UPI001CA8BD5F|nr:histidine phosphatase family protein [Paenibacillus caui]